MFCPDPGFDIFDRRGLDRQSGCAILLRPDQYVAAVTPLDAPEAIAAFFKGVFAP
jgi:phenol 2-monooxygenase